MHEAAAQLLADQADDRRLRVWVRVRLGGERRIDVARSCGYKDGSAITQILKRLERQAQTDRSLGAEFSNLRKEHQRRVSSVNGLLPKRGV